MNEEWVKSNLETDGTISNALAVHCMLVKSLQLSLSLSLSGYEKLQVAHSHVHGVELRMMQPNLHEFILI